jgi:DNA-binding response OmpR family regulator
VKRNVLLVAPTPELAAALVAWLAEKAFSTTHVTSFGMAKDRLMERPSLLIAEVRLGEYNGLHLAIHAHALGIPTIVIGEPDAVLQRDAEQLGAVYLTYDLDHSDLVRVLVNLPIDGPDDRRHASSPIANLTFLSRKELDRPA